MWSGEVPKVDHLRSFGCKVYVRLEKQDRAGKMSALAWLGVLVGWNPDTLCYRVWDLATNKVHNVGTGHADFDESVKPSWWRGQKIGKKARVHEPVE